MIKRLTILLGLMAVSVFFSLSTTARDLDQDEALRLRLEGVILPFEQLMLKLQQRYPQLTLLEAELEEKRGLLIYEVDILTNEGVVRELKLDARSGDILKDKEDD